MLEEPCTGEDLILKSLAQMLCVMGLKMDGIGVLKLKRLSRNPSPYLLQQCKRPKTEQQMQEVLSKT